MRARNLKPGFFDDEDLHLKLGPHHAILFAGLWCLADKQGKLEDRPIRIKANIMPYYEVDADKMLSELEEQKFIQRYSVNGNKYLKVLNFCKHQHPHHTEKDSVFPDPLSTKKHTRKLTVNQPLTNGDTPSDSLIYPNIPDSLNTDSREAGEFEVFWKTYPKKKNKGQAEKVWERLKPNTDLKEKILKKVEETKKSQDWIKDRGKWIPYPATWLNAKGWEDEIEIQSEPKQDDEYEIVGGDKHG
jgi:hypothetical protein